MQVHVALMGEVGERPNLARLVDSAHFRGLRNGNDSRLHVMFVADTVVGVTNDFYVELAIGSSDGDQLAAGELFGRATLVGVDVRRSGAEYRVIRLGQSLQAEDVRSCSVEDGKDLSLGAKVFAEGVDHEGGVGVGAVADHVAFVDECDGFENFGMNAGVVVAGEAANGLHARPM